MRNLLLLLWAAPASAMRLEASLADVCSWSSMVIIGEVTTTASQWAQDGGIETMVDVVVERTLKGPPLADVNLVTRGGQVGELIQRVEHAAILRENQRVMLLMTQREGRWIAVGGDQGVVDLARFSEAEAIAALGACYAK